MEYLRKGHTLRPPRKPRFVKAVACVAAPASPSEGPITTKESSESIPVFDEDVSIDEAGTNLPQTTECFQEPDIERSITPSEPPRPPSSPRLRQLDEDVPMWDSDDEVFDLRSPQIPSDMDLIMDLDDDVPVWDPEERTESRTSHQPPQSSSSEGINAYQKHLRALLRGGSAQQARQPEQSETPRPALPQPGPTSVPGESSTEAPSRILRSIRMSQAEIWNNTPSRQIHPHATGGGAGMQPPEAQKGKDSDKKVLEELFRGL